MGSDYDDCVYVGELCILLQLIENTYLALCALNSNRKFENFDSFE